MKGVVIIDTNLLVLLIVGAASKKYIAQHKRLRGYTEYDFELLGLIISEFSDIALVPHTLAEVSTLIRQIANPARAEIQAVFRTLITTTIELPVQSAQGAHRSEFDHLGLTDAVLIYLCSVSIDGLIPSLITADSDLADGALALGYSVIDYRREYQI